MSAAVPADHGTLDQLTFSFGALERDAPCPLERWWFVALGATRVENVIDTFRDFSE
jgi:hypothetical protein